MTRPRCFIDRVMARVEPEIIAASVRFVRKLANRLEGNRLGIRVTAADMQAHYGPEIGFIRACIALTEMTRCSFTFEQNAGRHRHCPLIIYVDYDIPRQFAQVYFTREGRELLQNINGHWTLRLAPSHAEL